MTHGCVIGEAARQSGVGVETIRYYEREGIIAPPARSASGQRVFSAAEVARLRFIRRCRDLGFALRDIRQLMALVDARAAPCAEAAEIGRRHLRDIREKRAELERLEAALERMLAGCANDQPDCALLRRLMEPAADLVRWRCPRAGRDAGGR